MSPEAERGRQIVPERPSTSFIKFPYAVGRQTGSWLVSSMRTPCSSGVTTTCGVHSGTASDLASSLRTVGGSWLMGSSWLSGLFGVAVKRADAA
jgi:hypothetical protein